MDIHDRISKPTKYYSHSSNDINARVALYTTGHKDMSKIESKYIS